MNERTKTVKFRWKHKDENIILSIEAASKEDAERLGLELVWNEADDLNYNWKYERC